MAVLDSIRRGLHLSRVRVDHKRATTNSETPAVVEQGRPLVSNIPSAYSTNPLQETKGSGESESGLHSLSKQDDHVSFDNEAMSWLWIGY